MHQRRRDNLRCAWALAARTEFNGTPSATIEVMSPRYVDSTEQLVTEVVVRDIRRSTEFYRRLGFELLRDDGDFVELTWEQHRLFLAQPSAFRDAESVTVLAPPPFPLAKFPTRVCRWRKWLRIFQSAALNTATASWRA